MMVEEQVSDRLFARGSISSVIDHRRKQLHEAILNIEPRRVLTAQTDALCEWLEDRFRLDTPTLDRARASWVQDRGVEGKAIVRVKDKRGALRLAIPFKGNPDLFHVHAGWYPIQLPRGLVRKQILQIDMESSRGADSDLQAALELALGQVERHLAAIRAKTEEFNNGLHLLIRNQVELQRSTVLAHGEMLATTGYPVERTQSSALPLQRAGRGETARILAVGTEWHSAHGGLSSFNRSLCAALSDAGNEVVCIVLRATPEEWHDAEVKGVRLVEATRTPGLGEQEALSRRPMLPDGFDPDVIIGHGRVTGPAAQVLAQDHFASAQRVHFIHMAPDEIEWLKLDRDDDAGERAEKRTQIELDLGRTASCVVAVGPTLHERFLRDLHVYDTPALRLDPGFDAPARNPRAPPPGAPWRVLLLGRLEDSELKGLDIAAKAVGLVASRRATGDPQLELLARGAPRNTSTALRKKLVKWSGNRALKIVIRPFTTSANSLDEDVNRASLVLMPSRTEGFGLVGLEAIVAGTPVLVSSESGLGAMLRETLDAALTSRIVIEISGDRRNDSKRWADAIQEVLADRDASFRQADEVRALLAEEKSWARAIATFMGELRGLASRSP